MFFYLFFNTWYCIFFSFGSATISFNHSVFYYGASTALFFLLVLLFLCSSVVRSQDDSFHICYALNKSSTNKKLWFNLFSGLEHRDISRIFKARIDKIQQNSQCWQCGDRDETTNHIISECSKSAQKEYKSRHDWVGKVIHWEMCKKFKFDHTNKWYMQPSTCYRK